MRYQGRQKGGAYPANLGSYADTMQKKGWRSTDLELITGISRRRLQYMHDNSPQLFAVVFWGAKEAKRLAQLRRTLV